MRPSDSAQREVFMVCIASLTYPSTNNANLLCYYVAVWQLRLSWQQGRDQEHIDHGLGDDQDGTAGSGVKVKVKVKVKGQRC